jgi:hypothetical protein
MNKSPRLIVLLASSLIACGGGSSHHDSNNTPDAPVQQPQPDAPMQSQPDAPMQQQMDAANAVCTPTATVFGAQDILVDDAANNSMVWGGTVTTDLGDGGPSTFTLEFYGGVEPNLATAIDLSTGNQANYSSCAECVRVITHDATNTAVRTYFQSGGTVTLTADPIATKHVTGTIANLALVEVTIDPSTYASTPVVGGKCISVGNVTLDHDAVPNAWTCTHAAYSDGATCDCACGMVDPDCAVAGAPVTGCTSNQVCSATATCIDKPANDTCQTATALTIGTPMMGTSAGASANYDTGSAGCTGYAEAGVDVAYSVALAAGTSYTFTLSNVDAGFDPAISIVGPGAASVCDAMSLSCLAGADAGFSGDGETFSYTPTAAGTYYVLVDTYSTSSTGGAFTIEVTTP